MPRRAEVEGVEEMLAGGIQSAPAEATPAVGVHPGREPAGPLQSRRVFSNCSPIPRSVTLTTFAFRSQSTCGVRVW